MSDLSIDASAWSAGFNRVGIRFKDDLGRWSPVMNHDFRISRIGNTVAPVITSNDGGTTGSVNFFENGESPTTAVATDSDGDALHYSISGGADAALFGINSISGRIFFLSPPDYESPIDANADNGYEIEIKVTDYASTTMQDTQTLTVAVQNQNDNTPIINSNGGGSTWEYSLGENISSVTTVSATDGDGDTIYYSISGGSDQALFTIGTSNGVLTFNSAPDFENPLDANGDNLYEIVVSATDDGAGNLLILRQFDYKLRMSRKPPLFHLMEPD